MSSRCSFPSFLWSGPSLETRDQFDHRPDTGKGYTVSVIRTASKRTTALRSAATIFLAAQTLVACATGTSPSGSTASASTSSLSPTGSALPASMPPVSPQPSISPPSTESLAPSPVPSTGGTFHVELANEIGKDLAIDVKDESGRLLAAVSGTPSDGASVPQNTIVVANEGPATLKLTWAGPPCAVADLLVIDATGASMILVQPECAGDAIAFDRILILTFSQHVSAADVDAVIQAGGDTPA
jgi:hypothetical protein